MNMNNSIDCDNTCNCKKCCNLFFYPLWTCSFWIDIFSRTIFWIMIDQFEFHNLILELQLILKTKILEKLQKSFEWIKFQGFTNLTIFISSIPLEYLENRKNMEITSCIRDALFKTGNQHFHDKHLFINTFALLSQRWTACVFCVCVCVCVCVCDRHTEREREREREMN